MTTRTAINPSPWSTNLGFDQAELIEGHRRELVISGQDAVDAGGTPVRSADSVVLALRAQVDPGDLRARFELRVGDDRFRIELADGTIEAERGSADRPDATIEADPDTLDAVLRGRRPLADAKIEGDTAAVERLIERFRI